MSWPFKIFDRFELTGKSNNKEIKQKIKGTSNLQQAGRDIHNYSSHKGGKMPLLFIRSMGWSSNQEGVSLAPEFLNDSDEVIFIESIYILGDQLQFEIVVNSKQSERTHLPSRPYPGQDNNKEIVIYYKNASNEKFRSRHTISLLDRTDGKFDFGTDIRFHGPVEKV